MALRTNKVINTAQQPLCRSTLLNSSTIHEKFVSPPPRPTIAFIPDAWQLLSRLAKHYGVAYWSKQLVLSVLFLRRLRWLNERCCAWNERRMPSKRLHKRNAMKMVTMWPSDALTLDGLTNCHFDSSTLSGQYSNEQQQQLPYNVSFELEIISLLTSC